MLLLQRCAGNRATAALFGGGELEVVQRQSTTEELDAGVPDADASTPADDRPAPATPPSGPGGGDDGSDGGGEDGRGADAGGAGSGPDAADGQVPEPDASGGQEPDAADGQGPESDADGGEDPNAPGGQVPESDADGGEDPNAADGQGPEPDAGQPPDQEPVAEGAENQPADPETETEEAAACEPNPEYVDLVERWGEPGSDKRREAIEQAHADAGKGGQFLEGLGAGGGLALATTLLEAGAVYGAARLGVSQAAKVAGPVGAVVGGIVGAYSLYNRGWTGIGEGLSFSGWGEGSSPDEILANNWNAVAEFLDVLGAAADVVGGLAGLVALGGTAIGLIPGLQGALVVVPIATKIAFWAGIVGLACGVMKGIAQYVSRTYRESHLLNMEIMNEEEMVFQQQQLTSQIQQNYQFLGGVTGAGAVAAGRYAHSGRTGRTPDAQGARSEPVPHEPHVVAARRSATPERLEELRQVDDALAGRPRREQGATTPERAETDAARDGVPEARERLQGAEGERTRTAGEAARAADEADARRTTAEQSRTEAEQATQDLETARQQRAQSEGARRAIAEQRARVDEAAGQSRAADASLDQARQSRDTQAAEVSRMEADARQYRETEARALEQYESSERGQMPLAIAEHAAARAREIEAELPAARERLGELDRAVEQRAADAEAARIEYEGKKAGMEALEEHQRGLPDAPDQARIDQLAETERAKAEQARADREAADDARAAADDAADASRQAGEDHDAARSGIDDADQRLRDAHERETRDAEDSTTPTDRARDVVEPAAGGGGTAQDVLGAPYEAPGDREIRVVEPCLTDPPPTSTAAIEADETNAQGHDTVAADAASDEQAATADKAARVQDQANLEQLDRAVQDRKSDAEGVDKGLDRRTSKHEQLDAARSETNTKVDEAGDRTSDLSSFARFVGRLLGVAGWFDNSLMPSGIQSAGRSIADKGQQIQETTSGTTSGIAEQKAGRGAVQAADQAAKAKTDGSKAALAGTSGTIDKSATQVGEMKQGNQQLQGIAAEQAVQAGAVKNDASSEAASLRSSRDQKRSALDAWAEESRAARQQWVDDTTAQLEGEGYEITGAPER